MTTYKIGTRGSLLAVTQSTLIKNELEKISGHKFELVLIKTQGDQVTDKPLWQLEGKDFFTKELDESLLKGEVDLVIHSYKDLGSLRPDGIKLAAITERKFAHDILLVPEDNIDQLPQWSNDFVVGTSSPRRITNLTHSLSSYLPGSPQIRCETLRGNVNSRIQKLKDGKYHAITLALAGIERLAHSEKSLSELTQLLQGLNYFILPQSVFPSAASQGALGIEIREGREDGGELLSFIEKLSHSKTIEEVRRERKAFGEFGGGCHLAVGIHVKKITEDLFLHVHAGEVNSERVEKKWIEGITYPSLSPSQKLFLGLPQSTWPDVLVDEYLKKIPLTKKAPLENKQVLVTSKYCIETLLSSPKAEGIWAAGTKSARELAAKGFWVNGTADALGVDDLLLLKESKALQIMHKNLKESWIVLSHGEATSPLGDVYESYQREKIQTTEDFDKDLKGVDACYWTSFFQYLAYCEKYPFLKKAKHFCGMGKTWHEFTYQGIEVYPLTHMQDFYQLAKETL